VTLVPEAKAALDGAQVFVAGDDGLLACGKQGEADAVAFAAAAVPGGGEEAPSEAA